MGKSVTVTDHDAGEINGRNGVKNDEDALVVDVLDAIPSTHRKRATEREKVKVM